MYFIRDCIYDFVRRRSVATFVIKRFIPFQFDELNRKKAVDILRLANFSLVVDVFN